MAEHQIDDPLFDYELYRFGRSRQLFRGPQQDMRGRYLSFIGASNTFGRFNDTPFPDLVGEECGLPVLNLGTEGAGPGFFLGDAEVLRAASDADVCVVQVMCSVALSNRMFAVRPRRNLRLHSVSDLLIGIFPEVEFDRFGYVHGMLRHLRALDENRFKLVLNEIKNAWIGRMQTLLSTIETKTVLFWFAQRSPDEMTNEIGEPVAYPHFIDRAMIDSVAGSADCYVECITQMGLPQDLTVDGKTVLFRPTGEPVNENREFPSPEMHRVAAEAVLPEVKRLIG